MSETPDKPSLSRDATCCSRIYSWAIFKDLTIKKKLYFFSVHFDHQGVEARRQSGKLMVQKIREIAPGTPVICVGDLNFTLKTEQVQTLPTLLNNACRVTTTPPHGPTGPLMALN